MENLLFFLSRIKNHLYITTKLATIDITTKLRFKWVTVPTFLMNGGIMKFSEIDIHNTFSSFLLEENLELYDLNIVNFPIISKIEVYVYSENGIDYKVINRLNYQFQSLLQDFNYQKGTYELVVSSPGIERKLKTKRHYELALGEFISVKIINDISGKYLIEGVLNEVQQETLNVNSLNNESININIQNIKMAKIKFSKPNEKVRI